MTGVVSFGATHDHEGDTQTGIGVFTLDPDLRAALRAFFETRTENIEYHDGALGAAIAFGAETEADPIFIVDVTESDDPATGIRDLANSCSDGSRIIAIGAVNDVALYHQLIGAGAPDAIDLIVRGLRSGLPVSESINAVGGEFRDPLGGEFRLIADKMKLGEVLEDALWDTAERLATAEFRFFVICLSVQRETGGNLAETLENLSDVLRRRRQMQLKIKAMASEGKASAMILGSLPFVMFAIMFFVNHDYILTLFQNPLGHMLLGGALVSLTIGVLAMAKMVRFEI